MTKEQKPKENKKQGKKQENKLEKKQENQPKQKNQKFIEKCTMELIEKNQSSSSSKISDYCEGKGFSYLAGLTQSQTTVVPKKYAKKTFQSFLQSAASVMSEKSNQILNLKSIFNQRFANDIQKKIIPHVVSQKKQLKIFCLDYIRKRNVCFMSYIVMKYSFTLQPHTLKQTIENLSSSSKDFKAGIGQVSLGYSSSSSSSYKEEKLIDKQRGMTLQDLNMLISLASINNQNRKMYLEMFHNNQFDWDIDE